MERWDNKAKKKVERPDIEAFLVEIKEVCRKHGFTLSTGDMSVGLQVEEFDPSDTTDEVDLANIGPTASK